MTFHIQILSPSESDKIRSYELAKLKERISDPMELEMATWNVPWRPESLTHYLSTGWSVGIFENPSCDKLLGYFLGQPLLFFKNLTQVLWLEHLSYDNEETQALLFDTAARYSREKHLQSVIWESGEIKTTKR